MIIYVHKKLHILIVRYLWILLIVAMDIISKRKLINILFLFYFKKSILKNMKDSMMFNKETTFENGILNLLFAKKAIIEFIDFIKKERFSRYNSWIIIQATDKRRFDVYKRGVKGLNFITEFHNGVKSLIWKEEKNE